MARGRFITLEGGEGAGKSTLAKGLANALAERGVEAVVTREPGGTPNAEALRALLVEGEPGRWSPMAETLLLYAAREDHVRNLIEPALERGAWVICDRFHDSTRAYQGAAGGLPASRIAEIHAASLGDFKPDLTLIVDLDPAAGLARTRSRGEEATRFERQPGAFHAALRQGFLDIALAEPDRCAVLDGARPAEEVRDAAMAEINARLGGLS
ncbi:MAG: dTMP kinase [Alphaproteobacteria bacterium]|nr:dTMP kinase [Alphaproteobacteria bacterium]